RRLIIPAGIYGHRDDDARGRECTAGYRPLGRGLRKDQSLAPVQLREFRAQMANHRTVVDTEQPGVGSHEPGDIYASGQVREPVFLDRFEIDEPDSERPRGLVDRPAAK